MYYTWRDVSGEFNLDIVKS